MRSGPRDSYEIKDIIDKALGSASSEHGFGAVEIGDKPAVGCKIAG